MLAQRIDDTHSNKIIRRLDSSSSSTVPPSTLSLPNRARIDSIFPFTPGTFCRHISGRFLVHAGSVTSRNFKKALKEDFVRQTAHQLE